MSNYNADKYWQMIPLPFEFVPRQTSSKVTWICAEIEAHHDESTKWHKINTSHWVFLTSMAPNKDITESQPQE